jgi:ATP-binding cassette subfamily B protein
MRRPSFFAEEIIQSSAMDCGPAALKCLLGGFGCRVDYDKVREACRTGVDGTSIDALQDLAIDLGFDASQHMVPSDALGAFLATKRPFLVVVRTPYGGTHFEVVWNKVAGLLQVMDPIIGRRWQPESDFVRRLLIHYQAFPADTWLALAMTGPFAPWLRRRAARLGAPPGELERCVAADGWRGMAALDCASRIVERLQSSKALPPAGARAALERSYALALRDLRAGHVAEDALPRSLFAVTASPDAEDQVMMRGAVLLAIHGETSPSPIHAEATHTEAPRPEARAKPSLVETEERQPLRELWKLVGKDLTPALSLAAVGVIFSAAGALVEAVIFRSAFTLVGQLRVPVQGAGFAAMIIAFSIALLAVEAVLASVGLWAGRVAEGRLRIATLEKLPQLTDTFLRTRAISDLAQRAQSLDLVRTLPRNVIGFMRASANLALTTVALCLLDPQLTVYCIAAVGVALAIPLLARRVMFERDLRLAAQSGALGTASLDVLRGLLPIRAHRAERAMRIEHENLLVGWYHAAREQERLSLWVMSTQLAVSTALVVGLVFAHVAHASDGQRLLLLLFWAQRLPMTSEALITSFRAFASARSVLLRVQEPLRATSSPTLSGNANASVGEGAIGFALRGASLKISGHEVLTGIDCVVRPGERIAIVGRSGAGKSSLIALLLGWHELAEGTASIDGHPVGDAALDALRSRIVWVDPAVHLWNRPLVENVTYGAEGLRKRPMAEIASQADLVSVLERLSRGLQTTLGEGGGLVSGGEGQRVRFARAACRRDAGLVLLDEPFRGLDRERRRALLRRVNELWPAATVLCVTHDVAETVDFERVLVIEDGRLVEDGSPRELLERDSRYRALTEADREAASILWRQGRWRYVRVDAGAVSEAVEEPS